MSGGGSFTLNGGGSTFALNGPSNNNQLTNGAGYVTGVAGHTSTEMGVYNFGFGQMFGYAQFYPIRASLQWQSSLMYGGNGFSSVTYHGTGDQTLNFVYTQRNDTYAVTTGTNGLISRYHVSAFVASPSVRSTKTTTAVSISHYNITNSTQRADSMAYVIVAGREM